MRNEAFSRSIAGRVVAGTAPLLLVVGGGEFWATAVMLVLTVLELLLLLLWLLVGIELVLQLQWAFHVSAAV